MNERDPLSLKQAVAEYITLAYIAADPETEAIVKQLSGGDPQVHAGLVMRLGYAIDDVPQAITQKNVRSLAQAPSTNDQAELEAWRQGIRQELADYRRQMGIPENQRPIWV